MFGGNLFQSKWIFTPFEWPFNGHGWVLIAWVNFPSYLPDFTSKCRFRDSDERNLFWFYEPPLMLSTGANSFTDSGLSSDILVPTLESLKCFREKRVFKNNMNPNQNWTWIKFDRDIDLEMTFDWSLTLALINVVNPILVLSIPRAWNKLDIVSHSKP